MNFIIKPTNLRCFNDSDGERFASKDLFETFLNYPFFCFQQACNNTCITTCMNV